MDILNQEIPLWIVIAYLVYGAAVQALPRPEANEGKAYTFLYGFAHALANNFALAYSPKKTAPKLLEQQSVVDDKLPPEQIPWRYPKP